MKVLITGATGFIGRMLLHELSRNQDYEVVAAVRTGQSPSFPEASSVVVGEINGETNWMSALKGVDVVIHLAGRAHILNDNKKSALSSFREVNVDGAVKLAHQASMLGVKRVVFISSIGVNGSSTNELPFDEESIESPNAIYAQSKLEAEQQLTTLLKKTGTELVIIRPPLVYAGDAPGNFARLLKLVSTSLPLPFKLVKNQRSMIALENLVSFIKLCATHPAAANQLFLVADSEPVSTVEIVRYLAEGMQGNAHFLPVPVGLMRLGASMVGKSSMFEQLCGSLVIDSSKARNLLGWEPPISAGDALVKAGKEYKANKRA